MGRKRNPERDKSLQRYIDSGGTMTLDELAAAAGVPKARISKWKSEDKWEEKLKEVPKKRGGQRGNKNAGGGGHQQKTAIKMRSHMELTQKQALKILRRRK